MHAYQFKDIILFIDRKLQGKIMKKLLLLLVLYFSIIECGPKLRSRDLSAVEDAEQESSMVLAKKKHRSNKRVVEDSEDEQPIFNEKLKQFLTGADEQISKSLFSSRDQIKDVLLDLIDNEKDSIDMAVYTYTDKDATQALIRALNRGIKVRLILDAFSKKFFATKDFWNELQSRSDSSENSNFDSLRIYDGGNYSLMHHKFIIFGRNVGKAQNGNPLLWTGSFNITEKAQRENYENVLITDSKSAIDGFKQEFDELIRVTLPYQINSSAQTELNLTESSVQANVDHAEIAVQTDRLSEFIAIEDIDSFLNAIE